MRELEGKMPPSMSLLANVEDIDNTIQLNKHYLKMNRLDQDDPTGLQYNTIQCDTIKYNTKQCNAMQCNTIK